MPGAERHSRCETRNRLADSYCEAAGDNAMASKAPSHPDGLARLIEGLNCLVLVHQSRACNEAEFARDRAPARQAAVQHLQHHAAHLPAVVAGLQALCGGGRREAPAPASAAVRADHPRRSTFNPPPPAPPAPTRPPPAPVEAVGQNPTNLHARLGEPPRFSQVQTQVVTQVIATWQADVSNCFIGTDGNVWVVDPTTKEIMKATEGTISPELRARLVPHSQFLYPPGAHYRYPGGHVEYVHQTQPAQPAPPPPPPPRYQDLPGGSGVFDPKSGVWHQVDVCDRCKVNRARGGLYAMLPCGHPVAYRVW